MRKFRAGIAHVKMPTRVGIGIWFPDADPAKVAAWLIERNKRPAEDPAVAARAARKARKRRARDPYLSPAESAQEDELQRRQDEVLQRKLQEQRDKVLRRLRETPGV